MNSILMKEITEEKMNKYLLTTRTALERVSVRDKSDVSANEFLDMAKRYYSDALHYHKKGDWVTAFASVNYAHAWIDAGARLGFFDVEPGSDDYVMPSA